MKKIVFFFALTIFAACKQDGARPMENIVDKPIAGLRLLTEQNPEWQYQNLKLYPVVAEASLIENQSVPATLQTLSAGMQLEGFRITERKQFGRSMEPAINVLTVQNKSRDTIFLMSGDVVTGGNQDRVIASDEVILPGVVKNIAVFCVEQGRWHFRDSSATPGEQAAFVFTGYYNVASPKVRQAVYRTGNQEDVWAAVAKVTKENQAQSQTGAYASLETESAVKAKREGYLRFFDGKFDGQKDVVGVIAVCNGAVLGVDIFGHPSLFRQKFKSLLHGYVAEASVMPDQTGIYNPMLAQSSFEKVAAQLHPDAKPDEHAGKLIFGEQWVHLYQK